MSFKTLLIGGLLAAAVGASASITAVGPFTGTNSEGFESFPNFVANGGSIDSLSILQNTATISDSPGTDELYVYQPLTVANIGLGSNGQATVNSGVHGLAVYGFNNAVYVTLTFNNAVNAFGGYFDDNPDYTDGISLFDSSNNQIGGTQSISHVGSTLDWYGWSSTDLIKSVVFTAVPVNGVIVMDDLQAGMQATPEPGSFAVLGLGALGLLIRRKKR